jgi:hypothetical protein
MWAVKNRTPYAAKGTWGRDKDGVHEWIVAVKGAFTIKPDGALMLADEQPEPLLVPEYNGEDGMSSLRYDADLVGPKPATDVLLNGTAYAPKGHPAAEFLASLRLGPIHKEIRIVGQRTWTPGMLGASPSAVAPVTQVPIVYERAYGGSDLSDPDPKKRRLDARNPVGCGLVARVGQALPNLEYPSGRLERVGPAGFGAIASYWSPRRELQGTYDEAWQKSRCPLWPTDWDPRSLLCSPADQRPKGYLEGGEPVELNNLTPYGRLRFALPRLRFTFRTLFSTGLGRRALDHDGRLATVIIEPDHPRVILVWLSTLAVRTDVDYLDETIVTEVPSVS